MKFKVGDKVRVKASSKFSHERFAGKAGTVTNIDRDWKYPYTVKFDGGPASFHANELERVD